VHFERTVIASSQEEEEEDIVTMHHLLPLKREHGICPTYRTQGAKC